MYKLGCYVSENDILSALSVMIVYFAIHHVLFEYIPLYYHLTCKRKKFFFFKWTKHTSRENSQRLGSSLHTAIMPGVTMATGPSCSSCSWGHQGCNSLRGVSWARDTLLEAQAGSQSKKYIILQGTLCDIGTRVRFPMGRVQNSQAGSGDQPRRRQIRGPASPDPGQEAWAATEKDRWKVMCLWGASKVKVRPMV